MAKHLALLPLSAAAITALVTFAGQAPALADPAAIADYGLRPPGIVPLEPPRPDGDGDGLFDDDETDVYGTDPNKPDTDGDGSSDGDEVFNKTDPKAAPAQPQPQPQPEPQPTGGDQGAAVLILINQQRAANGCGPVASNAQLTAAAQRHANDLANNGITGGDAHKGSDNSTIQSRIAAAGYAPAGQTGEIVYQWTTGAPEATPDGAVKWWMGSPGHRPIIVDCGLVDAGFATATGRGMFNAVGDFGRH